MPSRGIFAGLSSVPEAREALSLPCTSICTGCFLHTAGSCRRVWNLDPKFCPKQGGSLGAFPGVWERVGPVIRLKVTLLPLQRFRGCDTLTQELHSCAASPEFLASCLVLKKRLGGPAVGICERGSRKHQDSPRSLQPELFEATSQQRGSGLSGLRVRGAADLRSCSGFGFPRRLLKQLAL